MDRAENGNRTISNQRLICSVQGGPVAVGLLLRMLDWLSIQGFFSLSIAGREGEPVLRPPALFSQSRGNPDLVRSLSIIPLRSAALCSSFSPRTSCGQPTHPEERGAIYTAESGVHHFDSRRVSLCFMGTMASILAESIEWREEF